jgi:membrane-associated phospholipid phosphatase
MKHAPASAHMHRSLLLFALAVFTPGTSWSQSADSAIADRRLFVQSDLYVFAGFTAATILMFPLDRHLATVFRDEDYVTNRALERTASVFRFFGSPGPIIIGPVMYAVGRLAHEPRSAELGLHGTEAIGVGLGTGYVIKVLAGRERPYVTADTNPHSFGLFRGLRGHDWSSFPSGHTTAAFAAAASVTAETRDWWPRSHWAIGTLMYGGATIVGLSRIYNDAHWASDVVVGAAIGTFAGQKTVRFNRTHTGNRVDRFMLGSGSIRGATFRLYAGDRKSFALAGTYAW